MTAAEAQVPAAPEVEPEPPAILSQTLRRSGRKRTRALAVLSLLAALGATGYVLSTAGQPAAPPPLVAATADAWHATNDLSDALRAVRPGSPRASARPLAGRAATAVRLAQRRVTRLDLPIAKTPARDRVRATLKADLAWIQAVRSTLADPRSPRRADLSRLAGVAATATALTARDLRAAKGSVGGTGRLLAATKLG